MTQPHQIKKSALVPEQYKIEAAQFGFGAMVDRYIAELQVWNDHHIIVHSRVDEPELGPRPQWEDFEKSEDPKADFIAATSAWDKKQLDRHDPYPKPEAPADVVASVATVIDPEGRVVFVPNFEIVNDDPTPDEVLAICKTSMISAVAQAESAAIEALLPPVGKRRLLEMRERDIAADDIKRLGDQKMDEPPEDMAAFIASLRPAKDAQFMDERETLRKNIELIQRKAAEAMAAVDDLTLDTLKDFQIPTFT